MLAQPQLWDFIALQYFARVAEFWCEIPAFETVLGKHLLINVISSELTDRNGLDLCPSDSTSTRVVRNTYIKCCGNSETPVEKLLSRKCYCCVDFLNKQLSKGEDKYSLPKEKKRQVCSSMILFKLGQVMVKRVKRINQTGKNHFMQSI